MSGSRFLILVASPFVVIAVIYIASFFFMISRDRANSVADSSFEQVLKLKEWNRADFVGPKFSSDDADIRWDYCWRRVVVEETVCIAIDRRPVDVRAYWMRGEPSTSERIPLNW